MCKFIKIPPCIIQRWIKRNSKDILPLTRNMGFTFMVCSKLKHNYIDPCLLEFFEDSNYATPLEERIPKEEYDRLRDEGVFSVPLYHDKIIYSFIGKERIRCLNGRKKTCDVVRYEFQYEGETYSEVFYVDDSLCSSKNKITAVLGKDSTLGKQYNITK